MKIVDVLKAGTYADKLRNEVDTYKVLSSLQGTALVRAIAYIEVWDLLQIFVLEEFGVDLVRYQVNGGQLSGTRHICQAVLGQVNGAGVAHNDVKLENFVVENGEVRLIDFSEATRSG
ncbi:hypothetical protein HDU89_006149 [Geranomyces variabilis]|nr:hypothetical protein HDU89_006149 [Geranomyces variabilis]